MNNSNQLCVKDIPLYWKDDENDHWHTVHTVLIFKGDESTFYNLLVKQDLGIARDGDHEHDITYGDLLPYADCKVEHYSYAQGDGWQRLNELYIHIADE